VGGATLVAVRRELPQARVHGAVLAGERLVGRGRLGDRGRAVQFRDDLVDEELAAKITLRDGPVRAEQRRRGADGAFAAGHLISLRRFAERMKASKPAASTSSS